MRKCTRRRQDGFSLVELLIVMAIFITVIALSSHAFNRALIQSKQESRKAESQVESIVGLEMLRIDVEHAGHGLPWTLGGASAYPEAAAFTPNGCSDAASAHNDGSNPPRALASLNGGGAGGCLNNSDYLVVKGAAVGRTQASQRWSYIYSTGPLSLPSWGSEGPSGSERVIAVRPKFGETEMRRLVVGGTSYDRSFSAISSLPLQAGDIVYGIDDGDSLRMPFNRADYYVRRPASGTPSLCAPNTGVLYKATVNHANGGLFEMPLLDCVADFQVAFGIDATVEPDGTADCYTNSLAMLNPLNAQNVRQRVRDVRIYVLTQEGQQDRQFHFDPTGVNSALTDKPCDTCLRVGETNRRPACTGETLLGRDFDLTTIPEWENYRWKVHTLVVKPKNLM